MLARFKAVIRVDDKGNHIGYGGLAAMLGSRTAKEWAKEKVELIVENREGKVIKRKIISVQDLYKLIRRGKGF